MDIDAYLREVLEVEAWSGYGTREQAEDRFLEVVADELGLGIDDPEIAPWREALRVALDAHAEAQASWSEPTANDRITAAFAELGELGVIALEDAGYTMSDGWEDVHWAHEQQPEAWGATFFHRQDVERGVRGDGLMLAFGAFVEGDAHEPESLRLARLVCDTLDKHGVRTEWSGSIQRRIEITPFPWQRRR